MTASPTHAELREMLPAAALDSLDPADLALVRTHVERCPACAEALEEYREVTGDLAFLLPPRSLDAERHAAVRARLLARVRGASRRGGSGSRVGNFLVGRWGGWAVAAGLAGVMFMHHGIHRPLDYGWMVAGGLLVALVALGVYAGVQRRRVSLLQRGLLPPDPGPSDEP
jgi:anti-sigma factor RsiW